MRKRGSKVAALFPDGHHEVSALDSVAAERIASATLGWIVALHTEDGRHGVTVDFPRSPAGPQRGRLAIAATVESLEVAIAERQAVVLVFEDGDPRNPIVVGIVAAPPAPARDRSVPAVLEADVDGRRVRVTARDEIVFECGQASVTLRRNGRVVIRGTYVETYSDGTNRIKGGQVQIN
jgi:Domain of unknown function (DUF6484)